MIDIIQNHLFLFWRLGYGYAYSELKLQFVQPLHFAVGMANQSLDYKRFICKNSRKPIIDNTFRIAVIKNCELYAVKSRQTVKWANPQITVRRLRYAGNRILWQSNTCRPNVKTVFFRQNVDD